MITGLIVKNYRNHQANTFKFKRVNWIAGFSGSGKSTIVEALKIGLTGVNSWTDGKGSGAIYQVGPYGKKSDIAISFDDGLVVKKTIPSTDGGKYKGYDKEIVNLCLGCREIFALDAKDQKDLFASILLEDLKEEGITKALNSWTPEFIDLGSWFQAFLNQNRINAMPEIGNYYTHAYSLRTSAKKELAEAKSRLSKVDVQQVFPFGKEDEEKVKKAFSVVTGQLYEIKNRGSESKKQKEMYDRIINRKASLVKELEVAEKEMKECEKLVKGSKVKDKIAEIKDGIVPVDAAIKEKEAELDKFDEFDKCPDGTCARFEIKTINSALFILRRTKSEMQKEIESCAREERELDINTERLSSYKRNVERIKEEAKELSGDMPPVETVDETDVAKKIDLLQKEYNRLEDGIAKINRQNAEYDLYLSSKKRMEEATAEVSIKDDAVKRLEAIVAALSPNGILTQLLQAKLSLLEKKINEKLITFFGMSVEFQIDPWMIMVKVSQKSQPVPGWQISWSEKARVSGAIQAVIAEATGFGIIGIDEHGLDISLRPALLEFLLNQEVQSIVLSTSAEISPEGELLKPRHPGIEDIAIFFMENGVAEEIKPN